MNIHKAMSTLLLGSTSFLIFVPAHAFEWRDLWFTPDQRASRQLDSEQYDELVESAPNAQWRGLGEYRKGEYDAAAKSFAQQRAAADKANRVDESAQAMYNEANAKVLNEQYAEAIELFDKLLETDPEHGNAQHNRTIADQLLQQQEQQEQQSGDKGEAGDEDQQPQDQDQQTGEDNQSGDQQQDAEQQDNESKSDQQQSENSDGEAKDEQQSGGASQDEQTQAEQDAQAAEALAAEQQSEDAEQQPQDNQPQDGQQPVTPLTEREQANEQWLRQIPDDPAGLLQRKIQNRHLTDYPKVKDSVKPW